jgi:hypothetical protein
MGRTVIAEDGIESYLSTLASKKELVVGLIFGQEISSQKSCAIHLARTPEPVAEENDENELGSPSDINRKSSGKPKMEDFDDSLVLDHARQVTSTLSLFLSTILTFYFQ